MLLKDKNFWIIYVVVVVVATYFILASPVMMDDGSFYEGFTESLARGKLDFKSYYGFQGLSFFAVPIYWLTKSHISIIITSMIFSLGSIPLAYFIGREFYQDKRAGIYFLIMFLLTPYPYTTMMRGFQESALLFFIFLIIYSSLRKWKTTPMSWAIGGIVKPFALTLLPLFVRDFKLRLNLNFTRSNFTRLNLVKIGWFLVALLIGALYLGLSYYQTGHLVNNAAINSYQGNFNIGNPPPLTESFTFETKGYARVVANLLVHYRKIMLSPLVIVLGCISLLLNKKLKLRKEIMLAIFLNFILVGSLSFSFSKYLLPMTTLFGLVAIPYLKKHWWLMLLVFMDSIFVFMPIWNYFGNHFWSNVYIYLTPMWLAIFIFIFDAKRNNYFNPNS